MLWQKEGYALIDFSALYGNDELKKHLASVIENRSLSHAYIVEGAEGSGRRTLCRLIAAALACKNEGHRPCGNCPMCEKIFSKNAADVHEIDANGDKTLKAQQIRDFRSDMYLSPTESEYKVYIIDDAEKMTAQAQNALLIILEEPPENTIIFLVTQNSSLLLPTIRSRTQILRTSLFTAEELSEYLPTVSRDAAKLKLERPLVFRSLLQNAGGTIGEAISSLSPERSASILEKRGAVDALLLALTHRRAFSEVLDAIYAFPQKRAELTEHFSLFSLAVRDLILLKKTADAPLLYFEDRERAEDTATHFGISRLFKLYSAAETAIFDIDANANISALVTAFVNATCEQS